MTRPMSAPSSSGSGQTAGSDPFPRAWGQTSVPKTWGLTPFPRAWVRRPKTWGLTPVPGARGQTPWWSSGAGLRGSAPRQRSRNGGCAYWLSTRGLNSVAGRRHSPIARRVSSSTTGNTCCSAAIGRPSSSSRGSARSTTSGFSRHCLCRILIGLDGDRC